MTWDFPSLSHRGAYYVMVDISEFGYGNDYDFYPVDLARKVGVGCVPNSASLRKMSTIM